MEITAENNKIPSLKKATNIMRNLKIKICNEKIKILPE